MPQTIWKPISFKPLTGPLDVRSSIDDVPPGSFRWKQNFSVNKDGKLSRAKGWRKAFNYECPGSNHDFHAQGVAAADREPLTMLFPSTAGDGRRRLFASTKTRVLRLDEATGLWTTLTGGPFGDDGTTNLTQLRFRAAELKDEVFFTNNFDEVQHHSLAGGDLIEPVPGLQSGQDDGAVLKAKVIISWNGVILLMNLVQAGGAFPSRILWSDLNNGLDWGLATSTVSDYQDLDYGHVILNAVPIGTSLYVFTDRSIWRCNFVASVEGEGEFAVGVLSLQAVRVYYEPKNKWKCLAYPNSLISDGRSAWYLGSDDLYSYTPGYTPEPESQDWLRLSTGVIFTPDAPGAEPRAIDPVSCNSPIAEARPDLNELHFSWPAFDLGATVTFVEDCNAFVPRPVVAGTGVNQHTLVVNTKFKTADYRDYGSTAMANFTTDFAGVGQCNQASAFLGVNGDDWTIKQFELGYGREMYDVTLGSYSLAGFFSILRGIFPFERFDAEKEIERFIASIEAEDPVDTAVARLRLGTSEIALDPNPVNPTFTPNGSVTTAKCAVLFRQLKDEPIKCRYTRTPEAYAAANLKPNDSMQWNYHLKGRFLYFELTLAAADHSAPTTGGCALSRFDVSARILA